MIDYTTLAASAGVIWDDSNKFIQGHMARVMMSDGEGFFHPCTCPVGAAHDAFVPPDNPDSPEAPQYIPLPPDLPVPNPANAATGNTGEIPILPTPKRNIP